MNLRVSALLSVQRALLGEVGPSLRGVSVEVSEPEIRIWAFFESPPSEEELEDLECVVTEVIADFPHPERNDPRIELKVEVVPRAVPIPFRGTAVFARKET